MMALASPPAHPTSSSPLIEYAPAGAAAAGNQVGFVFVDVGQGAARLFAVVQGVGDGAARAFFSQLLRADLADGGTPAARLLRAASSACRTLERRTSGRLELAGFGFTALRIDREHTSFVQLLPSQAYLISDGIVRALPESPMPGAGRVNSTQGRRWEVELDVGRVVLRPGATIVLCSSERSVSITPSRLLSASTQDAATALGTLSAPWGRGDGTARDSLLVIRVRPPTPERVRARLFQPRRERIDARPAVASDGAPRALFEQAAARYRRDRNLGIAPRALELLGASRRSSGRRRYFTRRLVVGVVALAAVAAAASRLTPQHLLKRRVDAPDPPALPSRAAGTAPTLTGKTVLVATDPFRAIAVVDRSAYVLDGAGQLTPADRGAPGLQPPAGTSPGADRQLLATFARDGDLFVIDDARTLWRAGPEGSVPRPVVLRGISQWGHTVAFATYAGNLYVLDAGQPGSGGQIWRYVGGAGGGFEGDPQPWLDPRAGVSLERATGFAIDGTIWVACSDGSVLRLSAGRSARFEPRGIDPPLTVAGAIYTSAELASLYVVDSAARRLLRISKEGALESQIDNVLPVGEHPRGLWVDPDAKTALVLTDRRLQQVTLS